MSPERLQKVLASAGIASRRECEELIAAGRVAVNGRVVREKGTRVDLSQDEVTVDNQAVQRPDKRTYIVLNKPVGVVSTASDPQERPTVIDLVDIPTRIFPVGRLDIDSEGLLLLTNDGELTHHLTHPGFAVEKEYRVLLDRTPETSDLRQWRNGVTIDEARTTPAWVELIERVDEGAWVRVVLREGRKRQIREVAKSLGYDVLRLIRVREDTLELGDLPVGQWRMLVEHEVQALRAHITPAESRSQSGSETTVPKNGVRPSERRYRSSQPPNSRYNDDYAASYATRSTQRAARNRSASERNGRQKASERTSRNYSDYRSGSRSDYRSNSRSGQRSDYRSGPRSDQRSDYRSNSRSGQRSDYRSGARSDAWRDRSRPSETYSQGGSNRSQRNGRPDYRQSQRSDARFEDRQRSPRRQSNDEGSSDRRNTPTSKPAPGRAWRARQESEQSARTKRASGTMAWRHSGVRGRPGRRAAFLDRSRKQLQENAEEE